jgi:serine protease Do
LVLHRLGRVLFVAVLGAIACSASVRAQDAARAPAAGQSAAIDSALARVAPSLVRIHVVSVDYQDGREVKRQASGSGTIITPEGHVITNHHVAGRTRTIICTLASREEVPAELVGTDPLSDIAVLKLKPRTPTVYPAAQFGDASSLRVGDRVLALGSPLALSQSVTMGIVSNTEMILPGLFWPFNRMTLDGEDVGSIVRWIGHDAPIFGGNSGGPLVNMQGEIVGINEISLGLAGAIPSDLAREVSSAIIRDGKVRRSWLGLEVQPLLKGSTQARGALVSGAIEGSPAAQAGFEAGDILLRLGARDVDVRFAEELPLFNQYVMRLARGKPVDAVVLRAGNRRTLTVVPVDRESVEAPIVELTALGVTASNLTSWSAKELRRAERTGVRLRGLRAGGAADEARPPMANDDVIVSVDGKPVKDVEGLTAIVNQLAQSEDSPVKVLIGFDRGVERLLTVVEIGRAGLQDPGLEARKAWVPITVQVLTRDLAEKLGLGERMGVRVTRVLDPSAGLQVGDVITAIDGDEIQASQSSDTDVFAAMIRQYKVGSSVKLSVVRGRDPRDVTVRLGTSPRLAREMKKYEDPNFEFRVRDIAPGDRNETGLAEGQPGVLVEAVREGGWAALGHLADGDVVLAIDDAAAADVATVQAKMEAVAKAKPSSVVLKVKRGIRTFFVELETGWK